MNRNQGSNPESPASGFSWLVFGLVFCALMLPASLWLLESERRQADTRLEMQADQARIELQRRLRQQESVLQAMVAFVQVNPEFHANDFDALVERLIAPYSHIRSVHFHPLIADENRSEFETLMRTRGQGGYVIRELNGAGELQPAVRRPWYLPMSFAAPLDEESDRRLLGLDLLTVPEVRETVDRALEHGMAAGPVAIPLRVSDAGYFLVRSLAYQGLPGGEARALMSIAAHSGQLFPPEVRPRGSRIWLEGPGLPGVDRPEVDQISPFPFGLSVVSREVAVGNQTMQMVMQRSRGWSELNGAGLLLLLGVALLGGWAGGSSWGQRQHYRRQLTWQYHQQRLEQDYSRAIANAVSDAIVVADAHSGIVVFNAAAELLTGWRRQDALGCTPEEVLRLRSSGGVAVDPAFVLSPEAPEGPGVTGRCLLTQSDGTRVPVTLRRLATPAGQPGLQILLLHSIDPESLAVADSQRDALTGLPDRQGLQRYIETLQADSSQAADSVILVVALPDLSALREHYDRNSADELLRLAGRILDTRRRSEDMLARLDDHRFALVLHGCGLADGRKVASDILQALRECHFSSVDRYLQVIPAAGLAAIATSQNTGSPLDQAILAATNAAQQPDRIACHAGERENVQGGDRERHPGGQRLLEALEEQRFELYAQPVMDVTRNPMTVHHYEILLRMRDEQGRLLIPAQFLPLAEREQLMARLDRRVLEQAMAWLGAQPGGQRTPMLAVNISAQSLTDDELVPWLRSLMARHGVAGRSLRLEFKEPVAGSQAGSLGQVMDALRRDGVSFSLDNFGTGPNGFLPLRHLTFEALKIDAALMQAATHDINEAAIVEAICHVAHVRGMEVAAEGVADAEILGMVHKLGISLGQGNYLGEPEPLNPR